MENLIELMVHHMLETFIEMNFLDMEYINRKMVESMKDLGAMVKEMVKENARGLMEKFMMENIFKIKNKDMVHTHGKMDANMMDIGEMVFNMVGED